MTGVSMSQLIYSAAKPMFKIYFIIASGYLLAKVNIFDVSTCRGISNAVVSFIMPCLIFQNIVSHLKSSDIKNIGIIAFTGLLLLSLGMLLTLALYFITRAPRRWFGGLLSVGLFPNISDLPIAYLTTFSKSGIFTEEQGQKGVAYVCIFLAVQIFSQFSLGLYRLIEMDFKRERKEVDEENKTEEKKEKETEKKKGPIDPRYSPNNAQQPLSSLEHSLDVLSTTTNKETNNLASNNIDTISESHVACEHHTALRGPSLSDASATSDLSTFGSLYGPQSLYSRRPSHTSFYTGISLRQTPTTRSSRLRRQRTENINDVISAYSEYGNLKNPRMREITSHTSDLPIVVSEDELNKTPGEKPSWKNKLKSHLKTTFWNFMRPNSVSLIISIAVAMAPPLKALFVKTLFYMPSAPDKQPPLSFVMDLASYVGNASVPLGLLMIGATIARLQVDKMPPGFWKTALGVTVARLIVLPIIGVCISLGFHHGGWYAGDKLIWFVSVIQFCLPSATVLVYLTAFYTDPNSPSHLQMDCLAVCLIAQYCLLCVALPFVVTFTGKVLLSL